MPNTLHLTAENPDELLNVAQYGAGAVIRIHSGPAEAGPFVSDGTAALVAGTRAYTYFDADGVSTTWYRTRYENVGATIVSDWSDVFQAGAEAGSICSIYDVEQRLTGTINPNDRELLLEFIRDATVDIEGHCGRWFVPRPLSGTTTYLASPDASGRVIWMPKGVRSVTAMGYSTVDQPDTGGVFTAIASGWTLAPGTMERSAGWPATKIILLDSLGDLVYRGVNRMSVTGSFGWAAPPADVAGIAVNMVIRRFAARGSGVAMAVGGIDSTGRVLRWTSPEEREKLDWYRDRQAYAVGY